MKMRKAYSIPGIVIILSFLSLTLSGVALYVSYHLLRVRRVMEPYRNVAVMRTLLEEIAEEMAEEYDDEYTSPYDGWFSELPEEEEGFTLRYRPADSMLDVNHLGKDVFLRSPLFLKDKVAEEWPEEPFYLIDDVRPFINEAYREKAEEFISLEMVPSLATADPEKVEKYCTRLRFPEGTTSSLVAALKKKHGEKIEYKKKGVPFTESEFDLLRTYFGREEGDDLPRYFVRAGEVNLNTVQMETFITLMTAARPEEKNYDGLWNTLASRREAGETVTRLADIFGSDAPYYEKFFSVTSSLFWVTAEDGEAGVSALIHLYRTGFGKPGYIILQYRFYEIEDDEIYEEEE